MDASNRRFSLGFLLEFALRQPDRQLLLLTPQVRAAAASWPPRLLQFGLGHAARRPRHLRLLTSAACPAPPTERPPAVPALLQDVSVLRDAMEDVDRSWHGEMPPDLLKAGCPPCIDSPRCCRSRAPASGW